MVIYGGTFFSESQAVISVDDSNENNEYGNEPWIFDLTGAEEPRILRDFMPGTEFSSNFNNVHVGANGIFYFTVNHKIGEFVTGTNLFRSDGTDNGTWMIDYLADTQTAGGQRFVTRLGEDLLYGANSGTEQEEGKWRPACGISCGHGYDLWKLSDIGYPSYSAPKPSYTVYTNDEMDPINFEVPTVQVSYNGNGTAWMVKDIWSGNPDSNPEHLAAIGNTLYFYSRHGISMVV